MIYYIVEVEADTLNERVMSSHDNLVTAMRVMEGYKRDAEVQTTSFTYRIDTVPSNEEVRERNAAIPADPHKLYDKTMSVPVSEYVSREPGHVLPQPKFTADAANGDYTLAELFGDDTIIPGIWDNGTAIICRECGSLVMIPQRHLDFHNKLLP